MTLSKLFTFFLILFVFQSNAQRYEESILNYLSDHYASEGLTPQDVEEVKILSSHYSQSMDVQLVYAAQAINGVPVFNAIGSFAVREGRVLHFAHSYQTNLHSRVGSLQPGLSPVEAINFAAQQLEIDSPQGLEVTEAKGTTEFIYTTGNISHDPIPVRLVWQPNYNPQVEDDTIRLAWDVAIHTDESWWSVRVDASTGQIIEKHNWTLTCEFGHNHTDDNLNYKQPKLQNLGLERVGSPTLNNFNAATATENDPTTSPNSYKAYPLGVESPNHGGRTLLIDPADEDASPFGWHDTDGIPGAEHTITRGNNVWAKEDRSGTNGAGYAPDGGEDLIFDFPLAFDAPPEIYEDAAITNLFVWNNLIHDVWHHYGFDEAAGNFQATNYSGEGVEDDFVFADAQDGGRINNANFATPPDGFNPRMQMFLWNTAGEPDSVLSFNSPTALEGSMNVALPSGFGPPISTEPITQDLVLVVDEFQNQIDPYLACEEIANPQDLEDKIAVIRRGSCTFVSKIEKAQEEGAAAVIIVNNEGGPPINMGGDSDNIEIPSMMVSLADGNLIIDALEDEFTVNATIVNEGPFFLDGDYDNGIIAHEYGHGWSTRLTGGASEAGCLFNEEQMGEGWSDWIGLMMTMTEDDFAEQGRGYGTFAVNQSITGQGIRPARYSTDTSVNPATYESTNNQNVIFVPHGIGFVWATMIWDLTWALIDEYGYDDNLYTGQGGNNIAMQLINDGLKLQNCNPGFVDGRDAILAADQLNFDGENECLIWEVFAERGLGFSADQGSASSRTDQTEAFDLPPNCTFSTQNFDDNDFKIWPNPVDNFVNIDAGSIMSGEANFDLYDVNGRKVMSEVINLDYSTRVEIDLPTGVYLLQISNGNNSHTDKLIIK